MNLVDLVKGGLFPGVIGLEGEARITAFAAG